MAPGAYDLIYRNQVNFAGHSLLWQQDWYAMHGHKFDQIVLRTSVKLCHLLGTLILMHATRFLPHGSGHHRCSMPKQLNIDLLRRSSHSSLCSTLYRVGLYSGKSTTISRGISLAPTHPSSGSMVLHTQHLLLNDHPLTGALIPMSVFEKDLFFKPCPERSKRNIRIVEGISSYPRVTDPQWGYKILQGFPASQLAYICTESDSFRGRIGTKLSSPPSLHFLFEIQGHPCKLEKDLREIVQFSKFSL
ncbi:hypothetical protein VNO77_03665 [Canavalia gladiata]|uniref:Uncharacterized protein n=1 Tax=Canavalia gladiata TaxID=3824 RepID=A0AAN9R450_CANGL